MIESKDISVVIQGAIDKINTPKCLKSIRKILPGAEIILSTWKGSEVDKLDYDVLVLNKDPGGIKHDFAIYNKAYANNNFNRQMISTQNGLKKATRKYILKLRTDLILKNNFFLKYWNKFSKRNKKYSIFNHRVLINTLYSREYSCQSGNGFPIPFHPSDFWFFGEKDDINDYFNACHLINKDEAGNWKYKYPNRIPYKTCLYRYAPEQQFCYSWVKKYYPDVIFEDWSDWNEEIVDFSGQILYNNFVFLSFEQSGIFSPKHYEAEKNQDSIQGLITYEHFQQQYKNLCDVSYVIKKQWKKHKTEIEHPLAEISFFKVKKHIKKFFKPFKNFLHWLSEPFSVLYYVCRLIVKKGKKYESR